MKKNKTVAYMLAATLLVGGTFLGTKALFTDKVDVAGELKISTGDVDIEVVPNTDKWSVVRNGVEHKHSSNVAEDNGNDLGEPGGLSSEEQLATTAKAFVNNLKPGDKIQRTVKIKNVGTLVATDINITNKIEDTELIDYKEAQINGVTVGDANQLETLQPGEEATVTLELEVRNVDGKHEETPGYNTTNQEDSVIQTSNAWELTASQQNERADLN